MFTGCFQFEVRDANDGLPNDDVPAPVRPDVKVVDDDDDKYKKKKPTEKLSTW